MQIEFRGKHVHVLAKNKNLDGPWIYGYLSDKNRIFSDVAEGEFLVDPETVGQFIGLRDCKRTEEYPEGQKIYVGDIVKTHYANASQNEFIENIVFHNGRFTTYYEKDGCKSWSNIWDGVGHFMQDKSVYMDRIEVIGNIHDKENNYG